MRITAALPFDHPDPAAGFDTMEGVARVGKVLEDNGFDGGSVTDHPAPTGRWLDNGGHFAQDPFVMLAMLGAVTTKLRLQTGILVLPYRNPFITARSVATLDAFTGGRVTLGVGAGYLKGEYKALGVDFDRRNEIMDEYLRALKAAWTQDEFTFEGTGYTALGNRIVPRPVQKPHPLLLIGGNSKRAIRRAVELGDGWYPFFTPAALSSTARTKAMADDMDIVEGVTYLREQCEVQGRATPCDIYLGSLTFPGEAWDPPKLLDRMARFAELGIKGCVASVGGKTITEYEENAQRYGEEIIAPFAKLDPVAA